MLHIVSESLLETAILERYRTRIGDGHSVLLIEDAVLAVQPDCAVASLLDTIMAQLQLFVLSEDLLVRGISLNQLEGKIEPVNYAGFVDLVAEHKQVQSW